MRIVVAAIVVALMTAPVHAENPMPYPGTKVIDAGLPFDAFVDKLIAAIRVHKMGVVADACATCGAKKIGVTIPGNRVIMIFNPHFAVRMLKASEAAGIEAPIRLYVTEQPDGNARLTYRTPSSVFKPYRVAELDEMARELDTICERIVARAIR